MKIIEKTIKIFAVAVELGMPADGTAIAVVQLVPSPSSPSDPSPDQPGLHLRHLKRFLPGTPYRDIAQGLLDLLNFEELSQTKEKTVRETVMDVDLTVLPVIDQRVVGSPVVDTILRKVNRPDARRVSISGSHSQGYADGYYHVPKPELISLIQAGLGWGLLEFAEKLPETKTFVEGLIKYQDRKTNSMVQTDPWREHESDDLVLAVGLACWELQQDTRFSYELL
jgi:hypothetical protein